MKRNLLLCSLVLFSFALNAQIFSEDFEGNTSEWTAENAWMFTTAQDFNSQYFGTAEHGTFAGVNDDALGSTGDGNGRLITPMIDFDQLEDDSYLRYETVFWNADYQGADETAKIYYSVDGGTTWVELYDDLDPDDFAGWRTVYVQLGSLAGMGMGQLAFEYGESGGWQFGWAIDDIEVYTPPVIDIAMLDARAQTKYVRINDGAGSLDVTVTNRGLTVLESFDIVMTAGTETYTESVTSNVSLGQTRLYTVPMSFATNEIKLIDISVEMNNFNFGAGDDPADNSSGTVVSTVDASPKKITVAEEATGTWCPWCPRGAVNMEANEDKYPDDFIAIAVHNRTTDPMLNVVYDAGLTDLPGFSGFPSVAINRTQFIDPGDLETTHLANADLLTPVAVGMFHDYDTDTREITAFIEVDAYTNFGGDVRATLVITEDEVTGTSAGYNQANNYAGGGQGVMGGYESLPNPVPASQMVYEHVARDIMGGFTGVAGSLENMVNGERYIVELKYTVPAEWNIDHLNIVALVIDNDTQEVLNGIKKSVLGDLSSTPEVPQGLVSAVLAPNPATDVANLTLELKETADVRMQLFSIDGQMITSKLHQGVTGKMVFPIVKNNLAAGTYYLKIAVGNNEFITKKVVFMN